MDTIKALLSDYLSEKLDYSELADAFFTLRRAVISDLDRLALLRPVLKNQEKDLLDQLGKVSWRPKKAELISKEIEKLASQLYAGAIIVPYTWEDQILDRIFTAIEGYNPYDPENTYITELDLRAECKRILEEILMHTANRGK